MIAIRTAEQCGGADYGWLKARYTFSFGHYFDPHLLGYASLRVLNQEVLAPGASLQPRTYPRVDVLNIILEGEAEYRDSEGHEIQARAGEAVLLSTQPGVSYSEHNGSKKNALTRLQLWLNADSTGDNPAVQKILLGSQPQQLIAAPLNKRSVLQLRQPCTVQHICLDTDQSLSLSLTGSRAYLQSIHGSATARVGESSARLSCGDGAFVCGETALELEATTLLRALLIDLPA